MLSVLLSVGSIDFTENRKSITCFFILDQKKKKKWARNSFRYTSVLMLSYCCVWFYLQFYSVHLICWINKCPPLYNVDLCTWWFLMWKFYLCVRFNYIWSLNLSIHNTIWSQCLLFNHLVAFLCVSTNIELNTLHNWVFHFSFAFLVDLFLLHILLLAYIVLKRFMWLHLLCRFSIRVTSIVCGLQFSDCLLTLVDEVYTQHWISSNWIIQIIDHE